MNIESQKKAFINHVATFTDYGNIKIVDFKNPNSENYRIRFLFEEDYCRLHISGDLGELIATNYNNMTFKGFSDFLWNMDYFKEKINCHSRNIYKYNEELAEKQLLERITEYEWIDNTDLYDCSEDLISDVLDNFSSATGICASGIDILYDFDDDVSEWAYDLGKEDTGILELYMLAFELAMKQISVC